MLILTVPENREATVGKPGLSNTTVRTFRIPKGLESCLVIQARENGISLNALVTKILTKYSEWEQFTAGLGVVPMSKQLITSVLDAVDEQSIAASARKSLPGAWKEMMTYVFGDYSFDSFLKLVSMASKYGTLGPVEIKGNGKRITVLILHNLGLKFSRLMEYGLDELLRSTYRVEPVIESTASLLTLTFSIPAN